MQHDSSIMPETCLADKMTIACSAWGQLAFSVLATYHWVNTGMTCCIVDQCSQQIVLLSKMPIYFGAVCSASDAVAEVAGSVRENIKLRRGFRYHFTPHALCSNA